MKVILRPAFRKDNVIGNDDCYQEFLPNACDITIIELAFTSIHFM